MPEQTSSYVGLGVEPPAYPTAVTNTPSPSCQNLRSAPQKQPRPKTARSIPSGYGPCRGCPLTKCRSAVGIGDERPGNASVELGTSRRLREKNMSVAPDQDSGDRYVSVAGAPDEARAVTFP